MSGDHQDPRPAHDHGDEQRQAMSVLRGIWSARGQTSAELEERFGTGHTKVCRNMKDIGFGGMAPDAVPSGPEGTNTPVDPDLRSAWRARLEREGKLRPGGVSIGEMIRHPDSD
ncbi:hypothetical protein ACVGVM_16785 [Pseudonocardia bannensis]|uniref:Uncharacterized protein n=1 Tax=Pseudonocardia bannensis TaxID=630973 RepID=A0A848DGI0_9PSEU|nr:hypothetical protein [Pseudonocardia bannensis]NMH91654.1 hypothetical protein [Pseudonocardia bannensis]